MTKQDDVHQGWLFLVLAVALVTLSGAQKAAAQTPVNPDAAIMQTFEQRVTEYMKLHKSAEGTLPALKKPTESPVKIRHHEHALRKAIVAQRPRAKEGNIFTPEICAEFRRLVGIAYQSDSQHIRESFAHAEPGTWNVRVHINGEYPDNRPLQSMPPSLLMNLPPLPPELEYRAVGRNLVLRDARANLVVDVIPRVIPK
jgi:hypothetical protein